MNKIHKMVGIVGFLGLISASVHAEEKKPLSPPAQAELSLGSGKIRIDYSAPSMRGRKIFGGLVPFDEVWRTGANAATTLKTDVPLQIGTVKLAKGSYTIFTLPKEKAWTLIINRQTGQWGSDHDAKKDLGRVEMTVKALDTPVETFAIALTSAGAKQATLSLRWEKTEASIPITLQ